MKPRRVAGVPAAGLHLAPPPGSGTTIRAVDLWVDPHSGLPLDVEVYAGSATHAALGSHFLDLTQRAPSPATVAFTPAAGTQPRFGEFRRYRRFRFHDGGGGAGILDRLGDGPGGFGLPGAPDVVQVLSRLSSVRLPPSLGGLARRTPDGQGVATYGSGFSVVAVLGVGGSLDKRDTTMLSTLPSVATAAGPAHAVKTPLLNGLIVDTGKAVYGLVGTVPVAQLQAMVGSLASVPGTTN